MKHLPCSRPCVGCSGVHQQLRKEGVLGQLTLDQRGGAAILVPFEPRGTMESKEALKSEPSSNPDSSTYLPGVTHVTEL